MENARIAEVFEEMANILDISGASFFRSNAYRKGAQIVLSLPFELKKLKSVKDPELQNIPGIGGALKDKIIELVTSGKCKEHEEMKKNFPAGLLEMLELRGVGPKKVKLFYAQLAIKTIEELEDAGKKHLLSQLDGMGEKSESEIIKAIEEFKSFSRERSLIDKAYFEAEKILEFMKGCEFIKQIEPAGSLRRFNETIGDLDFLVAVKNPQSEANEIMEYFIKFPEIHKVIAKGETKSSVILESGIQADLRVVKESEFGTALHYFTGDKEHNIRIRNLAISLGLKVNEYGVFKGEKKIAGENEEECFKALGLPFIIPEIRKNNGEVEHGLEHKKFPNFVSVSDIMGDLHNHSVYSDGTKSIEEMAEKFAEMGYEYFAMTDHSAVMGIATGMDEDKIKKQWQEIDKVNEKLQGKIRVLKGCEVDILKKGELDFADQILEKLEVLVISAHLFPRLPQDEQSERILKAIKHAGTIKGPKVKILGHPTGRIINKRVEMELDMEKIINSCVENGITLEINCATQRLDLPPKYLKLAKGLGAKFTINTDSHNLNTISYIKFGVGVARQGWLTKEDVLNCRSLQELI